MESDVDELYLVTVRKYGLDANSPWWRRWYFRAVYLPFVRFSFKRMGIPACGSVDADGRFSWLEYITIATDEEAARARCDGEFYDFRKLPVNSSLPRESIQYKGHIYPHSTMPDRYRRRTFPTVTSHAETIAEKKALAVANDTVDRLIMKARSSPA
jgi:hypothetical protein